MYFDKSEHRCLKCGGFLEEIDCDYKELFICEGCGKEFDIFDLKEEYDDGFDYVYCELCGNEIKISNKQGCFTCPECGSSQNI